LGRSINGNSHEKREYLSGEGLYDVFLASDRGDIVYNEQATTSSWVEITCFVLRREDFRRLQTSF